MLRAGGAQFLVIPRPAFAWLDRNPELAEHLRNEQVLVTRQKHVCEIYELRASSSGKGGGHLEASGMGASKGGGPLAGMRRWLRGAGRNGSGR
jgi:hypothetical protein